jgi:hypothetical protein
MFDLNTKVQWRTGGRGVFRVVKGVIIATIKAGKLPIKSMQDKVPHGDKPSNRDRYIVEVKDGVFAWANVKTTFKQGEKLPPAKHRFGVKSKPKGKAKKKIAKVKAKKVAKPTLPAESFKAPPTSIEKPAKKSGGDKPKTTWYSIVDGKIVSVRKVLCPEGFSKDKPTLPEKQPEAAPAPAPAPAAEQPALPQAV